MAAHRWQAEFHIPALIAHKAFQSVRVDASNWKAALRQAVREAAKLPALKGKRIKTISVALVRSDVGKDAD
jgi:hypothetical protein